MITSKRTIVRRLIVGCTVSLFVLFSYAAAKELSVTQYGALPNDGKDDAAALRRAVDACGEGDRCCARQYRVIQ